MLYNFKPYYIVSVLYELRDYYYRIARNLYPRNLDISRKRHSTKIKIAQSLSVYPRNFYVSKTSSYMVLGTIA